MMDLNEMRKWAGEMERSAEALMTASGGDKHMMSAAVGSSRVSWLLAQAANEIEGLKRQRDELAKALRHVMDAEGEWKPSSVAVAMDALDIAAEQPKPAKPTQEPWQFDYGGPAFPQQPKPAGGK